MISGKTTLVAHLGFPTESFKAPMIYNPQALIISKKTWDSMSAEEKKIIGDAAAEATKFQREASRAAADTALDTLKKAGMTVTELPPAEMAKLRDKVKPVIDKHTAAVGDDVVQQVQAEIAKVRKP